MESRIFVNRKGDKVPIIAEEISYDLGKTWQRTGKTKPDEDNIEYNSCDCSENWDTEDNGSIVANCVQYETTALRTKNGCAPWEKYKTEKGNDIIFLEKYIENVDGCEQNVFHKTVPNENGIGYEEYVWIDDEWVKITC